MATSLVTQWADEAVKGVKPYSDATHKGECYRDDILGIRLIQTGRDRFTVVYGKQVKRELSYGRAAHELGSCIMHALACDGLLDNRERRGE